MLGQLAMLDDLLVVREELGRTRRQPGVVPDQLAYSVRRASGSRPASPVIMCTWRFWWGVGMTLTTARH